MLAGLLDKIEATQPEWLHQSSPFIYLTSGLVLALAADGALAKPAGTLLILYGLRIARLRWMHRGPRLARDSNESARKALRWNQSCACNHETIDAEHRELFAACRNLQEVANDGQPDATNPLIRELIRRIEGHYHREEKIFQECCPAGAVNQQCDNHARSARTHALYHAYLGGRVGRRELIDHIVHEAVVGHTKQAKATLEKSDRN